MKVKSDYLIYCDESCPLEYEPITLLGTIGCSYEKKEQIVKELRDLKNKYFINSKYETKWVKTSKSKIEYYKELINYFYNNDDIRIRILVAKNKEYSSRRTKEIKLKIRYKKDDIDYLIILNEKEDEYFFITAYPIFEQREKKDLDKDYNSKMSKKLK